ncbi:unnamed protein product [Ranitomeya imitator]|uniref:Transposase Tc1-like domain-containing protein n=1 Tax=Ranitomeya imitator TaxID=111125 RepID=A0ABN9LTD8_9NEOB|nr:unnamed protein product [Ranitomeya imitator]
MSTRPRGVWDRTAKLKTPFDNISSEEDFHMNEKTTVKVPFMRRTGMYKVTFTDLATVVSIPCKADVEVLLIWPAEGKLSEIEENINEEKIQEWKKSMDMHVIKKFKAHGTVANLPICGRKGKIDKRVQRKIVRMLDKEPRLTSKYVQAALQSEGTTVSTRTIRRHLNEKRLYGYISSVLMLLIFAHSYVDLLLPKLDVSSSINVQEKLTITPLADLNSGISDLSGINGEGNAKISRTVRKAIFGLDKKITDSDVSQIIEIIVDPPPIAVILPSFI